MWWLIIKLVILALLILTIVQNIRKLGFRKYSMNLLVALDIWGNTLIGGKVETISARCEKGQKYWYWRVLARILNAIDPDHIQGAR